MKVKKLSTIEGIGKADKVLGIKGTTVGFFEKIRTITVQGANIPVNLGKPPLLFIVQNLSSSLLGAVYFCHSSNIQQVTGHTGLLPLSMLTSSGSAVIFTPTTSNLYEFLVISLN